MSGGADADIALLNGMLEQWGRGEFWDGEPYADDVVFVRSGPDGGEYHGIDESRRRVAGLPRRHGRTSASRRSASWPVTKRSTCS